MSWLRRSLLTLCSIVVFAFAVHVVVSPSGAEESDDAVDGPSVTRTQHRDWVSICVGQAASVTRCAMQQVLRAEQPDGRQLQFQVSITRQEDQNLAEIALPLGLDLRAGVVVQVDESDEINIPIVTCLAQGCVAVLALDDPLIEIMKRGSRMKLGFLTLGSSEVFVAEFSLMGFTRAYEKVVSGS